MEELHSLLHSLSRAQIRLLRNYLTCFSSRGESEAKTLLLVEFLLKSTSCVPTVEDCSMVVYDTPADAKILKLKSRLKGKILDSLLLDINLDKKALLDKSELMTVKLRKKIAQLNYLFFKHGAKPLVKQMLDEIVVLSKQYEYYSGLVEALRFKKNFKGFRIGEKEFFTIKKEMEFYVACSNAVTKAQDCYYLMIMRTNFQANVNPKSIQSFLRESIGDLKKEYEYTQSANVGYYLKYLEQSYFENSKDYYSAREACLEQLAIVNNNVSVYRKQRVGIIYDNLAQYDILLGQYERAINNAVAAQKHFIKKSTNYFVSKEVEFYALFYSGLYARAKSASSVLLSAVPFQSGDFRNAKYSFFRANVLFIQGEVREAFKLLNKKLELSKDKSGWEIAIRILTVMCHIEQEDYDYVTQLIDSLRRHIDRQGKQSEIKERDKLIVKVLQQMSKRGFAQGQVSEKEIHLLRQLAGNDKKCKWEPLTPELIPFHEWAVKKYRIDLNAYIPAKKASKRKVSLN